MPGNLGLPGIAIVGMGCIFPKSGNLKEYWRLLFNGIDAIQDIPGDTHWQLKDYFHKDPAFPDHTYCKRGGFLPHISFDPLRYGIPPNNLDATDTSQLLGLEVARMALEDAGYAVDHPFLREKKVNVILGVTGTQELVIPLGARLGHPIWKKALADAGVNEGKKTEVLDRIQAGYAQWQENSFPGLLGNVVAGRIANRFNLSGTNAVSDAACASSLSAIHSAVMELSTHKCDMSITGGVDTLNDIFMHMCFSKTGVLSHTSDAKPFSKDADGTVLGEGIGMLALKRLADAEKDGDRIYAVIKGVGTSSDGRTSAIYAPEAKGQLRALKEAYAQAGVDPAEVDLVEAHGTGTRVGDKVEFTALTSCFDNPDRKNRTAIGSVKSMIGHTKAAAGAAGIIKTALALHHKVIPPTLKADAPDPDLDINNSSFYLNNCSKPWVPSGGHPRRSGISAFGFGGSNFHAVLEEYTPEKTHLSWDGSVQIIAFSGPDVQTLKKKLREFAHNAQPVPDSDETEHALHMAWLARETRKAFSTAHEFRLLMVVEPDTVLDDLVRDAMAVADQETPTNGPVYFDFGKPKGKLGFLFPGQGSQYTGMGKDLYAVFPEALDALASAGTAFTSRHGDTSAKGLSEYMFPLPGHLQEKSVAESELRQTWVAQPAIGSLSIAMTDILARFGIRPDVACGHSFGELSAMYAAGWIDKALLNDLACARGDFMARAGRTGKDAGSMLAVQAPLADIEEFIRKERLDLVLANKNSQSQGVLSGATGEIKTAQKLCRKRKMRAIKLPVAAAFHSPLVADAAKPFEAFLAPHPIVPTQIPVLSNTTGNAYAAEPDEIKTILGNQLMHPVNFTGNIKTMRQDQVSLFLEVGPKTVLTGLVKRIAAKEDITALSLDASSGQKGGVADLAAVLCQVAAKGFRADLTQWEDPVSKPPAKRMRVMLSGANPKPRQSAAPPSTPVAKESKDRPQAAPPLPKPKQQQPSSPAAVRPGEAQGSDMSSPSPPQTPHVPAREAMHLVQKGLEAMQQLQAQTARAHEKFLETQAQATQTLAGMMEQTRGFTDSATHAVPVNGSAPTEAIVPPPLPAAPSVPSAVSEAPPAPYAPPAPSVPIQTVPAAPAPVQTEPATAEVQSSPVDPSPVETSPPASSKTREVVFETVSRLTGFPEEMLEPDMDIESDLGIDSIKKVEIVSELEKQLPDSPGLTTENIGSVRTLADICQAITPNVSPQPGPLPEKGAGADTTPSETTLPTGEKTGAGNTVFPVLVNTISELTGFPVEMLEPEMSLESDLGIDSIKRVEILSRLEQELPGCVTLSAEEMAGLQTIGDITAFLSNAADPEPVKKNSTLRDEQIDASPGQTDNPGELLRQTVTLTRYPTNQIRFYNGAKIELPPGKKVYITRDAAGISQVFQTEFEQQGITAQLIDILETSELKDAAGIVLVQNRLDADMGTGQAEEDPAGEFLKSAFCMVKKNAPYLAASGVEKGAFLTGVTFLGSGFGFDSSPIVCDPAYGGLAGLIKTAGLEWKDVLCRALDLPADAGSCRENAEAAVALMMTHGEAEMGLNGDHCNIPTLTETPVETGEINLHQDDVVVVTGGAKGVTAACALALAENCSPKIILVGRSPFNDAEPDWARGIMDPAGLKKAILTHEFQGQKPKPADLEKRYKTITSNREIQQTLADIQLKGSAVRYISADIRNSEDLTVKLEEIRSSFGPVTVVIHGAGVLEDKLITDKLPDQFNRVYDTKVGGLKSLLSATQKDPLKYLVLFSSVAARSGNIGQCDYATANEVLNKTAFQISHIKAGCKTIAINWGPWDGGMVNEALKKEFTRKGIGLIPLKAGAEQFIAEMGCPDSNAVEVVIGALIQKEKRQKTPVMSKALEYPVGLQTVPVLYAHRINREPVMPFALLAELMAHTAEKNNPGLIFAGLDEMRILKGVRPGSGETKLGVSIGKCVPDDTGFQVPVNISSLDGRGNPLNHAQATAVLQNRLPTPPVLSKAAFMDLKAAELTVKEAYEKVLFHGTALQCIKGINGISSKGIEVTTATAPAPGEWLSSPLGSKWVIDPLMLDAAFQTAILWTWKNKGQVCLPSYLANLRIYASYNQIGPGDEIRILFTVNEETAHSVKGYFTFLNADQIVLASITGFEAVIDPTLHDKFKPEPLFPRESILAFAEGSPSQAFGDRYNMFDSKREIARLPRPPYFFMDRVLRTDHPQWEMVPGGWIETEYDIPADAWYFDANRTDTIPFCILLEIALQPCGWLAAYAGSALHSDQRLHFRNLGGKARLRKQVTRQSGTLLVRSRMTDVSKAGGMIIQDFDMQVFNAGYTVYEGTTNFGFFTGESLANQVGIRNSQLNIQGCHDNPVPVAHFTPDAPLTPQDTKCTPNTGMPSKALCMIDTIDCIVMDSGIHNAGYIKASKQVDPSEWFFDAHFFHDPVCPGSLGIESFLQMLRFFLLKKFDIDPEILVPHLPLDQTHEWIYRGQIIPRNKQIELHAHICKVSQDSNCYFVTADGALTVDGVCIYEMKNFQVGFKEHPIHTKFPNKSNKLEIL